jgi:branched-chain amino acid transport system permease protein
VTALSIRVSPQLTRVPRTAALIVVLVLATAFPILPFVPLSVVGSANLAAAYALVAVSLVVLTGYVGQISLGHAAFVGVGGYATGWAASALKLPFPVSAPVAAAAGALAALIVGAVALRVRGLYLAVATLIFSWMADQYLFRQEWMTKHSTLPARRIGAENQVPSFDLTSRTTVFYLVWALVILALYVAANVRDSKTGRAFFAVRGSEIAAASLGIDVTRYKLLAFGMSGAIAGLAGAATMGNARVLSPDQFTFNVSLFFLAIAVVGGIRSLPGGIASAILFASLSELFFRVEALGGYLDVVSSSLLVVVLLVGRGGLASLGQRIRLLVTKGTITEEEPDAAIEEATAAMPELSRAAPVFRTLSIDDRHERKSIVSAKNLTVRFGGLTAVDDVSLQVQEGEIVGLIGPNGAGKTVTFNSIAGLVIPTEGSVELYGQVATSMAVHERARLGVARTFQLIQLFPQLSVRENLMVATHSQNSSTFLANLLVSERSVREEHLARQRVEDVIRRLRLTAVADARVKDLPFGLLRMVEVARALVTGYRFIMLDEPASGLDNRETDALVEVLGELHSDGLTLLLIEHDVKLVTSVSDYVYVLDRGKLIAEGDPGKVAADPAVIKAYIGGAPVEAVA